MHRARPEELKTRALPALTAHVSASDLAEFFPVRMDDLDPFSAPEPSKAALVRLDSGPYVVVIYGKETETLKVLVPEKTDMTQGIEALLSEVPLTTRSILWRCDRPTVKAAAHRHGAPRRRSPKKLRPTARVAATPKSRAPRKKR